MNHALYIKLVATLLKSTRGMNADSIKTTEYQGNNT